MKQLWSSFLSGPSSGFCGSKKKPPINLCSSKSCPLTKFGFEIWVYYKLFLLLLIILITFIKTLLMNDPLIFTSIKLIFITVLKL